MRNKNKKNLGGKIEQSSDEEVQEESVGELLPGESNDVDKTLPENVETNLPGEGQPVHDEGGGEPVEVHDEGMNAQSWVTHDIGKATLATSCTWFSKNNLLRRNIFPILLAGT